MLLSEALAERAEANERLTQIQSRLTSVVRIQEGDEPAENPTTLLAEAQTLMERIEHLVRAINHTNSATAFGDGNLTDALAHRDHLLAARRLYNDLAEKSSERHDRYSHNEIKYVSTLNVAELRHKADKVSQEYRELDTRIQQVNWTTDVIGLN